MKKANTQSLAAEPASRLVHWIRLVSSSLPKGANRIDVDTLPDAVKRDLGFLDGRGPRHEDERWR